MEKSAKTEEMSMTKSVTSNIDKLQGGRKIVASKIIKVKKWKKMVSVASRRWCTKSRCRVDAGGWGWKAALLLELNVFNGGSTFDHLRGSVSLVDDTNAGCSPGVASSVFEHVIYGTQVLGGAAVKAV